MSILCSLSSEPCQDPVVTKNGDVYERRLIEKHIASTGTDPVTKTALSVEDLISIKVLPNPAAMRPKTVSQQGIPAMLTSFQSEWDAVMLECFTLRQQLTAAQQELSLTLYQHDAACRVISRVIKERDGYKAELAQLKGNLMSGQENGGSTVHRSTPSSAPTKATSNGMDVDEVTAGGSGLPGEWVKKVEELKEKLSDARGNRKISPSVSTRDQISSLKAAESHLLHKTSPPGISCLDVHTDQNVVVTGGVDGTLILWDKSSHHKLATLSSHSKPITAVRFLPGLHRIVSSSQDGTVKIWANTTPAATPRKSAAKSAVKPREINWKDWEVLHSIDVNNVNNSSNSNSNSTGVTSLDVHPVGDLIVATFGSAGLIALIDANTGSHWSLSHSLLSNGTIDAVKIHPDGEIMASAGANGVIQVWDLKSFAHLASFEGHTGPITSLSFSENGTTLASASDDHTVRLWDLQDLECVKTLEVAGSSNIQLSYDHSGRFLAATCAKDIKVFTGRNLDLVASLEAHGKDVTGVKWGDDAKWLASSSSDRSLKFWSF